MSARYQCPCNEYIKVSTLCVHEYVACAYKYFCCMCSVCEPMIYVQTNAWFEHAYIRTYMNTHDTNVYAYTHRMQYAHAQKHKSRSRASRATTTYIILINPRRHTKCIILKKAYIRIHTYRPGSQPCHGVRQWSRRTTSR